MRKYDSLIGKKINIGEKTVILHKDGNGYEGYYYSLEVGTKFPYRTILADSLEGQKLMSVLRDKIRENEREQKELESRKRNRQNKGEVTLEDAIKIARDYYAEKGQSIYKIYETDEKWIAFAKNSNMPAITINKADERIGSFALPYKERTEILKDAVLHQI